MDLLNEVGIFYMCICFLQMCDSSYNMDMRTSISYIHVGLGALILVINFAKMLYVVITQ